MSLNPIVDISEHLPTGAEEAGYRLISRRGGYYDGYQHNDCAWLQHFEEGYYKTVCAFAHWPTLGEVSEAYKKHREKVNV